jgi:hypothetical protein
MMRMLFLFFLLLNAAYFYTQFSDSDAPASSSILTQPTLPQGVDKLTLLRERGLGGTNMRSSTKPAQKSVVAKPAKARPAKPASKPVKTAAKKSKPKKISQPQKPRDPACFTLGPFAKAQTANRSITSLKALGVEVKRRQVSRRTPKGYWVYLPASKSYQSAKRKVKELQKKGLKDLFIMGKGSRKNAISLGLFKQESAAKDRFKQVKKLGLKAVLETQYRLSEQAWLDITVPDGKASTVASITELADDVALAELSQRKCR